MRRSLFTGFLFVFATLFAAPQWGACQEAPPEHPNLVFIFVDDMGYGDPSCFGNTKVETPNMDALAAEGLKLTNFYVVSPICSPSRVGVTTGHFPARHGFSSYLNDRKTNRKKGMPDFLDPEAPAIARAFKKAGYATAHFGKWHMGGGRDVDDAPLPSTYGFDEHLVSFEGLGDRILFPGKLQDMSAKLGHGEINFVEKHEMSGIYVDRSIDFIRRKKDEPFYLHLWFNDVHDAHVPKEGEAEKFAAITDNPYEQKFFAVLTEMDRQIGRLVGEIDELGLAGKTLIVLTSDNGPTAWPRYYKEGVEPPGSTGGYRGRKWSIYEGGIRMPFIARWPGHVPAGETDEATIMGTVDFFPTFCALALVETPDGVDFDGQDMSQALLGQGPVERQKPLFWEYGRDKTYLRPGAKHDASPNLAVRDGKWKFLINADGTSPELYDLESDPKESENLIAEQFEVTEKLKTQLLEWRKNLP